MVRPKTDEELSELTDPPYSYRKMNSLDSLSNVFNSNDEDENSETTSTCSSKLITKIEDEGIAANLDCVVNLNILNPITDIDGNTIFNKCRTNILGTLSPSHFERIWDSDRQYWYGACNLQVPRTMLDDIDEDFCFLIGSRNTNLCIEGTVIKAQPLTKPRRGTMSNKFVLALRPTAIHDENGKSLFRVSQRGGIDYFDIEERPISLTVKHNSRAIYNLVHQQTTIKCLMKNSTKFDAIQPWGILIMDEGQIIATVKTKFDTKIHYSM